MILLDGREHPKARACRGLRYAQLVMQAVTERAVHCHAQRAATPEGRPASSPSMREHGRWREIRWRGSRRPALVGHRLARVRAHECHRCLRLFLVRPGLHPAEGGARCFHPSHRRPFALVRHVGTLSSSASWPSRLATPARCHVLRQAARAPACAEPPLGRASFVHKRRTQDVEERPPERPPWRAFASLPSETSPTPTPHPPWRPESKDP